MEDSDPFVAWVRFHSRAFGLSNEQTLGVAAWRDSFAELGYTDAELTAASKSLLKEVPGPKFLNDHRDRIHELVRDGRAYLTRAEVAAVTDYGSCSQCSGSGWVVVPHPLYVKDGVWLADHNVAGRPVRPMATVTCNCFKGRANEGIQAKMSEPNRPNHTKKPMTIAYYRDNIHSDPWGLESKTREADTNAKIITKKKA